MKLRVHFLYNPIEQFQNPEIQDLFVRNIAFRFKAYDHNYKDTITADKYDYISDHGIIEDISGSKPQIIACFRNTKYQMAKRYGLDLPCLSLLRSIEKSSSNNDIERAFHKIVQGNLNRKTDLSYSSSYAVHPDYRRTTSSHEIHVGEAILAMYYFYCRQFINSRYLCFGMTELKTREFFNSMGFNELTNEENEIIQPKPSPFFNGKKAVMMYLKEFTDNFKNRSKMYELIFRQATHWKRSEEKSKKIAS